MPEPVLVSIAAALAGRTVASLYDLVKKKFADRAVARAALARAEEDPTDSARVEALAAELATAERADSAFSTELREMWSVVSNQRAENADVINQVSGNVGGNVVTARDIDGGVRF